MLMTSFHFLECYLLDTQIPIYVSTYCSSHADPNSPACVAINFLNIIKEEDLFVKLLSLVHYNCVFLPVFGTLWWTVLSTSSIQHEHPLRTLMQISYTYAHMLGRKATNVHSTIKFVPWYIFFSACFWMWHSIRNCTYARCDLRYTKHWHEPTNQL